jgi:hypothetical protein
MNINPAALGIVVSIFCALIAYITYLRNTRKDGENQGREDGELIRDVSYIKNRVDDVLLEQKKTNEKVSDHAIRLAVVEVSVKSAHLRLDEHLKLRKGEEE